MYTLALIALNLFVGYALACATGKESVRWAYLTVVAVTAGMLVAVGVV